MSTATASPNSDCQPETVPLRGVERELNRQLKCIQDHKGVAPVVRAGLSNLMIYCNSEAMADEMVGVVPAIVAIHPARCCCWSTTRRANPAP